MSVASAPAMSPSSEDPRSLPPFSNFIALSSRPPLHPHSNSFSDPRFSLAHVPSSPERDQKDAARPPASGAATRTSPTGLDRANSTGKGSGARADDSGPANDDPDRPKRKRQSQSKFKYFTSDLLRALLCNFTLPSGSARILSHMPRTHVAFRVPTSIDLNFSFDFINYPHLFFHVYASCCPLPSLAGHKC